MILAGGLTPENVARAIAEAQPFAVDIASGVEARPGKKDARALRALMRAVESANRLQGEARNGANTVKTAAAVSVAQNVGPGAAGHHRRAQTPSPICCREMRSCRARRRKLSDVDSQGHARSRSHVA